MRNYSMGMACALAIVLSCSNTGNAQTKTPPSAAVGDSGHVPDISGVWSQEHPRSAPVTDRYWIYKFTMEEPPMTAWGEAQYKAAKSSFGSHPVPLAETNDPIYHNCSPSGYPRIFLHPFPVQIIQMPGEVILLFEWDSLRHQIFTDGRPHDTALGPLWMGDSIGHWEGDTLVADTVNFNDKSWLDRMGHPHSEALHIVERIRRIDQTHLVDDMTFEDSKAYTKPWTAHMDFVLKPTWTLGEQFCEDEESFQDFDKKATTKGKQ